MFSWALSNRFALPVILLAVVLTLLVMARAIWYFVTGPEQVSFGDQDDIKQNQVQPTVSVDAIMQANLFGFVQREQVQQSAQIEDTKLKLILVAIYENFDNDGRSSALIQQDRSGSKANRYYENDSIVGVATIEEIQPDQVILNRGGNRERLSFITSSIFVKGEESNDEQSSTIQASKPSIYPAMNEQQKESFGGFGVKEEELLERAKASDFTIGEVSRSPLFHQLGLKRNDRIISVNNISTKDIHNSKSLREAIGDSDEVQVEIQRGDRRMLLTVPKP